MMNSIDDVSNGVKSDEELVRILQTGNRDAEETLVRRYFERMGFFLLDNTWHQDLDNLEDVRQKIFLRAIEKLRALGFIPEGPNTFRDWLYTLARNVSHEEERHYAKLPKPFGKQLMEVIPSDAASTRPAGDIEQNVQDLNEKAEQLLDSLSAEERLLLHLVNDSELSYSQVRDYTDEQGNQPFKKYRLPNLRRKVCDLKRFLYEEALKWQRQRNLESHNAGI